MKRFPIFLICLILSIGTQAQDLTFDQTVSYIRKNVVGRVMYPGGLDSYSRVKGYNVKDIIIQKNGDIEIQTDQKYDANDFKINFNFFDLVSKVDYPDGVRAYKFLVHFNGLNVSSGYGITFATDADAERVARAFRHLKNVCVKGDDPFNKPTEEEKKPQLSRQETIDYINNILQDQSQDVTIYLRAPDGYKERWSNGRLVNPREYSHTISYGADALTFNSGNNTYSLRYSVLIKYDIDENKDVTRQHQISNIKLGSAEEFRDYAVENYTKYPYTPYSAQGIAIVLNEPFSTTSNINTGVLPIFIYGTQKQVERLGKAFTRLIELQSDEKDPFD